MELRDDKFIYIIASFTSLCVILIPIVFSLDGGYRFSFSLYLDVMWTGCYVTFILWSGYYYFKLLFNRESHPICKYLLKLWCCIIPIERFLKFILNVFILNLSLSSYTYLKNIIPQLVDYRYDELFYEIDKFIHFGFSPWELTHSIFSNSYATLLINFLYNIWFFLMWGLLLYALLTNNTKFRNQIILSFLLCWLLIGNLSATLLSSAGPAFMHLLDSNHQQYLPLINLLEHQRNFITDSTPFDLWAMDTQMLLWNSYIHMSQQLGSGISAMPSMHVSIAVLMALAGFSISKKIGYCLSIFALFIQVGSVHLAWHYAIDGYVSTLLTFLVWWSVKWLIKAN
ncbi:phosphatase PAP2 family protein [Vibrio breoganii]|uniref:phosphatase PAP2 family protein n=1 Tax=Vibrio breoganii TaxID=553239 RepID=UPI0012FFF7EA|nr:phosphatase PAP2 family protein [Vibrio breoganii]